MLCCSAAPLRLCSWLGDATTRRGATPRSLVLGGANPVVCSTAARSGLALRLALLASLSNVGTSNTHALGGTLKLTAASFANKGNRLSRLGRSTRTFCVSRYTAKNFAVLLPGLWCYLTGSSQRECPLYPPPLKQRGCGGFQSLRISWSCCLCLSATAAESV
jgi:hypothetical protein